MVNKWDWLKFCESEYEERAPLMEGIPGEDYLRLRRAIDLFGGPQVLEGKKVIEIGSQDGLFSMFLRTQGAEVTALDMISKWIRYGYDHDQVGVNWIVGFGENLPIKDQVFDMVFLGEVLEHSVDPEELLRETRRIARPGAQVLITVPWVVLDEPTHLHDWPSFKWRGLIEKYLQIVHTEIFRERWFIVVATTTNNLKTIPS